MTVWLDGTTLTLHLGPRVGRALVSLNVAFANDLARQITDVFSAWALDGGYPTPAVLEVDA